MSSADHGLLAPIWAGRPVATVTGDAALVDAMIEVEVALARAQGVKAAPGLPDAAALAARSRDGGNPVIPLLAALDDPLLHRGATSQDVLDTALMLAARRALTLTALDLDVAIDAAARLAADHRDTPMAARTLTQQAVPTTFGLKAAGWRHLLITARRAVTATAQALPVQLGGAAGTLASFVAMAEADAGRSILTAGQHGDGVRADRTPTGAEAASEAGSDTADLDLAAERGSASTDLPPGGTEPALVAAGTEPAARLSPALTDTLPTGTGLPFGTAASDSLPTGGAEAGQPDSAAAGQPDQPDQPDQADRTGRTGHTDPAVDSALDLVSRLARNLGLATPLLPWHVLRTPIADLASSLALASGALGKIAADVLVLARTEVGEVSEGAGGVSSTMPHKANPVRAALIASAARQVPALASILFASVAAEDERPAGAWHAEWQPLREALRLVGGSAAAAAELLAELRVHPGRMAANLAFLDLAEARRFAGREVSDPRDYLGAASALVDRALRENP
ncbi:lyase family protein [Catenulispora subtropica]|uniref:Fumarate lyase N-terminal domain-containing protein n=1 Tax=Catenulispora subtropica TaxID=450798 RepID=A0ABN2RIJ7_9ACTN